MGAWCETRHAWPYICKVGMPGLIYNSYACIKCNYIQYAAYCYRTGGMMLYIVFYFSPFITCIQEGYPVQTTHFTFGWIIIVLQLLNVSHQQEHLYIVSRTIPNPPRYCCCMCNSSNTESRGWLARLTCTLGLWYSNCECGLVNVNHWKVVYVYHLYSHLWLVLCYNFVYIHMNLSDTEHSCTYVTATNYSRCFNQVFRQLQLVTDKDFQA